MTELTRARQAERERLAASFYRQSDVVLVAQQLLGTRLVSQVDGERTAGIIVETEAYRAPDDRACHAYGNRRTARTEVMFGAGGLAYVYLCYGIHHLFNVVTGKEGEAQAVLVRAIRPSENIERMRQRRRMDRADRRLTGGPGRLAEALGIHTGLSGSSLLGGEGPLWIEKPADYRFRPHAIVAGPRIGVESAGQCAARPWRFYLKDCPWVSR